MRLFKKKESLNEKRNKMIHQAQMKRSEKYRNEYQAETSRKSRATKIAQRIKKHKPKDSLKNVGKALSVVGERLEHSQIAQEFKTPEKPPERKETSAKRRIAPKKKTAAKRKVHAKKRTPTKRKVPPKKKVTPKKARKPSASDIDYLGDLW